MDLSVLATPRGRQAMRRVEFLGFALMLVGVVVGLAGSDAVGNVFVWIGGNAIMVGLFGPRAAIAIAGIVAWVRRRRMRADRLP